MSSKLDKSVIVAGAGLVASIFTMLVKKVREAGGTDEDIHRLATPEGENLLAKIADLIVGNVRQTFRVLVDYSKSLAEMIQAGHYDWKNDDITQDHFPIKGSGQQEVEVVLFHFGRNISSDDAIAEMKKAGYRPAKIEELLALGASQPELQKQYPIVGLGSVWQIPYGDRSVPFLIRRGARRFLYLLWFGRDWDESCRFAAVRNAS